MIERVWHGWTTPEDAAAYERLLEEAVVPEIAEECGPGYEGFRVQRRRDGEEVEFMTVIRFSDWDAVRAFAGEDYQEAHVPPAARELLERFDDEARHYEVAATYDP